jgi:hypothetical protein
VIQMGSGPWFHAFELRFLLSDGALSPFRERESLKNRSAYLIPVPDGFLLYANLLIGSTGTALDAPLPTELVPAGQALWRARLRDGRVAALVGRLLELDGQNRQHIKYLREQLKPTVNFSKMPSGRKYVEVFHLHWSSQGGNVVLAVPMGEEAFRAEDEATLSGASLSARRHFRYHSPASAVSLIAPNGSQVAVLELHELDTQLELVKGLPNTIEVGLLTMRIEPANLIAGSTFIAAPHKLVSTPSVGAANPRTWEYMVFARFDGFRLSADLRQNSVALQNRNVAAPVSQLDGDEELLMTIPNATLSLSATLDAPATSATLLGRFTLRNWR